MVDVEEMVEHDYNTKGILRMRRVKTVECEGGPGRKECTLYERGGPKERTIEVDEIKVTGEVLSQVDWSGNPQWHGSTADPSKSTMTCGVAESEVEMGMMDPRRHGISTDDVTKHRVLNCSQGDEI